MLQTAISMGLMLAGVVAAASLADSAVRGRNAYLRLRGEVHRG